MKRTTWINTQPLLLLLVLLLLTGFETTTADSSFQSFNLCNYFGGRCGRGCNTYYRHKWGIPLCPEQTPVVCCAPEQDEPVAPQRPAPSPTTSSTPSTSLFIPSTTTPTTTEATAAAAAVTTIETTTVKAVVTTDEAITESAVPSTDIPRNVTSQQSTQRIQLSTAETSTSHVTINGSEAQPSTVNSYSSHTTTDIGDNSQIDDTSTTTVPLPSSPVPTISASTSAPTERSHDQKPESQHSGKTTAAEEDGGTQSDVKSSVKQHDDSDRLAAPDHDKMVNDDAVLRCGIRTEAESKWKPRKKRIVGGRITKPGIWPWQVSVRSAIGMSACSGVLIAPGWVLTAAHCFKYFPDPSFWRIRVGEFDLAKSDLSEMDHRLRRIFKHPDYVDSSDTDDDDVDDKMSDDTMAGDKMAKSRLHYLRDIALVQLENHVSFGKPCCSAICLTSEAREDNPEFDSSEYYGIPEKPDDIDVFTANNDCWVTGWGMNKDNWTTTRLQEVRGTVLTSSQCETLWQRYIPHDMLCFGDGSYGPCMGDSGGPLMCRHATTGQFYVVGIVSWGTEQCGRQGYPSVFTRVASYIPWMTSVITQAEAVDSKMKRPF